MSSGTSRWSAQTGDEQGRDVDSEHDDGESMYTEVTIAPDSRTVAEFRAHVGAWRAANADWLDQEPRLPVPRDVALAVDDIVDTVVNRERNITRVETIAEDFELRRLTGFGAVPSVNLTSRHLNRKDIKNLGALFGDTKPVSGLYLDATRLTDKQAEELAKEYAPHKHMTLLGLAGNRLTHQAVRQIDKAGVLSRLQTLILDGNDVGDRGAMRIAASCLKNPASALQTLSLGCTGRGCGVTSRGASKLAEALERNTTLRSLMMTSNTLGTVAAYFFGEVVFSNRHLRKLHLDRCGIGKAGGEHLLMMVEGCSNRTLQRLETFGNEFDRDLSREIQRVLDADAKKRELYERRAWLAPPVECRLGCEVAALLEMQQFRHETRECMNRIVSCPLECGDIYLRVIDHDQHMAEECPNRILPCPMGCEVAPMKPGPMEDHLANVCIKRSVKCRYGCAILSLIEEERPMHEVTDCPEAPVPCKWGCGKNNVKRREKEVHEAGCLERIVDCPLGGGCEGVRASTTKKHMFGECPLRTVWCKHGCQKKNLLAKDQDEHENAWGVCPTRKAPCRFGCGTEVVGKFYKAHEDRCTKTWVGCRFKCGKTIDQRYVSVEDHERDCPERVDPCPRDCGEEIAPVEMEYHLDFNCERRPWKCKLKCGLPVEWRDQEMHVAEQCPERVRYCSAGCGERHLAKYDATHCAWRCAVTIPDLTFYRLLGGKYGHPVELASWEHLGGLYEPDSDSEGGSSSEEQSVYSGSGEDYESSVDEEGKGDDGM